MTGCEDRSIGVHGTDRVGTDLDLFIDKVDDPMLTRILVQFTRCCPDIGHPCRTGRRFHRMTGSQAILQTLDPARVTVRRFPWVDWM